MTEHEPEYPEGEEPTTPPTEHDAFDPDRNWVNYWDMNPVEHGGKFVRWDGEMWECVEVTPPSAWREDAYIIEKSYFEPADVWTDPDDPMTDFTDDMKSILESLGETHLLPNVPPFLEDVTCYVADLTHYHHGRGSETFEIPEGDVTAYWNEVSAYGVDPDDVEGVSSDDLPDTDDGE
jgi:hypothetical protein